MHSISLNKFRRVLEVITCHRVANAFALASFVPRAFAEEELELTDLPNVPGYTLRVRQIVRLFSTPSTGKRMQSYSDSQTLLNATSSQLRSKSRSELFVTS